MTTTDSEGGVANAALPSPVVEARVCAMCSQEKPISAFNRGRRVRDGIYPYCKPCGSARTVANDRLRKYGVSASDFDALLANQDYRCAICRRTGEEADGRSLALDHSHQSGRIRGLLCFKCNTALGALDDDPVKLRRAADYLELAA